MKKEHAGITANYSYTYDKIGNLLTKPDLAETAGHTYQYGAGAAGPHALTQLGNRQFQYDANGNLTSNGQQSVTWTEFNKPKIITNTDGTFTEFKYGSNHMRVQRIETDRTTTYLDASFAGNAHYELIEDTSGTTTNTIKKHYYSIGGKTIAIDTTTHVGSAAGTTERHYAHHDYLGSIIVLTNNAKNVVKRFSYDIWGKRQALGGGEGNALALSSPITHLGFTGHEMIDSSDLVHMNGRIYDPAVARFMSADPFIQFENNSQSYNRYSYVLNNPLAATDPSGYFSKSFAAKFHKLATTGVIIGLSIYTAGAATTAYGAVVGGALSGAVGSGLSSALSGAGARNFTKSVVLGAISGGATRGLTGKLISVKSLAENAPALLVANGVSQGTVSSATGGSFRAGFVAAAIGGAVPGFDLHPTANVAISAIIGGSIAELSGGEFEDGAMTFAFNRLFGELSNYATSETDRLKNLACAADSNQLCIEDSRGVLQTDGVRGTDYTHNPSRRPAPFGGASMAAEGSGMHLYDEGKRFDISFVRNHVVDTSKIHDWMNSWSYSQSNGLYQSRGPVFDTAFSAYSFAGMMPASLATFIGYAGNASFADQSYFYNMIRQNGQ